MASLGGWLCVVIAGWMMFIPMSPERLGHLRIVRYFSPARSVVKRFPQVDCKNLSAAFVDKNQHKRSISVASSHEWGFGRSRDGDSDAWCTFGPWLIRGPAGLEGTIRSGSRSSTNLCVGATV